ncbi:ferric iron reductase protein FhuF [Peribacillus deserti]|uniref:Ferric iron reductase protein FhuF n=1 Tax=Peribacillus deserti TaxID=673318 RepID=A0ABS2QMP9_9BACI|nr:IucA/IucC family C-terminal-domain containing protein [Peribacillus deserti]MBM7694438.1 ferric iron reductase protein FhuF [Peribacillus deserti]
MYNRLTKAEFDELANFRLTENTYTSNLSFSIDDLLIKEKRKKIIAEAAELLQSPNKMVAASILTKRLAFVPVIALYAFSRWNKRLQISFENIYLETGNSNAMWLPEFRLKDPAFKLAESNRDTEREEVCTAVFAELIYPIMDSLNEETKLSKYIMWENISVYIVWMYETLMGEESCPKALQRLNGDFEYVTEKARGEIFGPYDMNPISRYISPKIIHEKGNSDIRYRTTCCFSYMLTGSAGKRCKTCPHVCTLPKESQDLLSKTTIKG